MNLKNNAKELFQDLDVYETRIIFCLINEPLTIYSVGLTWDKFLKTGVHLSVARSRIKGKRVNEENLIERGYVKLVREVPYKGKIKQFYGLTFKGLCAAYAYGKTEELQKEFLKKLTDNWEEYGYSNEVEMRASLKLWLKYRLMIQKQGYSKIYVIQDWKEDFKLSGYRPFAQIMSEVAWRTMKVFPHYGPTITNFTRLFTDYGLDEDEAEALSKRVHESKILRLNRHHMEIMEIILNKKYDENIVQDISGYIQARCIYLRLKVIMNPKIISYLLEKNKPDQTPKERDENAMRFMELIKLESKGLLPSCPINKKACPYGKELINNRLKCDSLKKALLESFFSTKKCGLTEAKDT